jgi:hypothetical protein
MSLLTWALLIWIAPALVAAVGMMWFVYHDVRQDSEDATKRS